uniref:P-type ATPase N-terminal domain-containing protein n=1 Tax=Timema douglasi TaxID=61478 RepID=A0A7R8VMD5_TIMDO|nr:unnamed protein product [Timema douglasi]
MSAISAPCQPRRLIDRMKGVEGYKTWLLLSSSHCGCREMALVGRMLMEAITLMTLWYQSLYNSPVSTLKSPSQPTDNTQFQPDGVPWRLVELNTTSALANYATEAVSVRRMTATCPLFQNNYIKTSKYSVLTFLPLNLFEQFQRLANFYFLCLLVLQVIPAISSLTPITTAVPLIGVLALTAVKDAYDDFQRHMSDSHVNNRHSKALRDGKLVEERWAQVQVGDVIRMENDQFVAADVLLLSTSEPNGLCFIETAELDGSV